MDEQRVTIIVQSQPQWVNVVCLTVLCLTGLAAVSATFFFVYCTRVAMRVLEGIGGP